MAQKCAIILGMSLSNRDRGSVVKLRWVLQAVAEVGPRAIGWYLYYQVLLRSGYLQRALSEALADRVEKAIEATTYRPLWIFPSPQEVRRVIGDEGEAALLSEAEEIVDGKVRLFGGLVSPLRWYSAPTLAHCCAFGHRPSVEAEEDIKFIWEPARFGWAFTLGRAYWLSGDERYPQAFWQFFESFLEHSPPYRGPYWISAQEVALRLIAWTFALQAFDASPHTSPRRRLALLRAVASHAGRIPATLAYAHAQNNNHLLSEAAGLWTAAAFLPHHPQAARWGPLGRRLFERGLRHQIAPDGAYIQHSTNYHRLMLQLGLWARRLGQVETCPLSQEAGELLAKAGRWLGALVDPASGQVPNLGPNDGAYLFPLTVCPFRDYRPVAQAIYQAFCRERPFPGGPWDEMGMWLAPEGDAPKESGSPSSMACRTPLTLEITPHILRASKGDSWAYLRVARFAGRPGHADQLHLDLWWRGHNLAGDAGSYRYNAPPPWDNALVESEVHNTVTVNGVSQMVRVGRFLFAGWAQGRVLGGEANERGDAWRTLLAEHDGYRRLGVIHRRQVHMAAADLWVIQDELLPARGFRPGGRQMYQAVLHWLLWDSPWQVYPLPDGNGYGLQLQTPHGPVIVEVQGKASQQSPIEVTLQLVRAGELLYGEGPVSPIWGWRSPTYGDKMAALSLRLLVRGALPLAFVSRFYLGRSEPLCISF